VRGFEGGAFGGMAVSVELGSRKQGSSRTHVLGLKEMAGVGGGSHQCGITSWVVRSA